MKHQYFTLKGQIVRTLTNAPATADELALILARDRRTILSTLFNLLKTEMVKHDKRIRPAQKHKGRFPWLWEVA